ncbi:MAG: hypothetical protein A2Z15_04980 [Chloroflexi bacterium RBG_16_50_11]|nr:MAG: hypothetical protein A2Z15_04980 [Chloroflexi bacterium RBG_16_50_11]
MRQKTPSYYPVFLNLTGRKCAVVGGGQVALRKVNALLEAGADVKIISPDLCPELTVLAAAGKLTLEKRPFRPADLNGAFVAVAATDKNDVNLEVARQARRKGILVNVVDDPGNSDFIAPSCLKRGDVTIAVSTAGRSPALARKIRMKLERDFGNEYAVLAQLIAGVRLEIKRRGIKVDGEQWQQALDLDLLLDLLKDGKKEQAANLLLANLEARK